MIRTKRIYEPPGAEDGVRILVDRLWPRGLKREMAACDRWAKEVAPSHELRKWFGHEPSRWEEFQKRFRAELARPEATAVLDELARMASESTITLVYAARESRMNNAEVLREVLILRMLAAER
jgi:uncharacterized protein YeaO (DUF488 family)